MKPANLVVKYSSLLKFDILVIIHKVKLEEGMSIVILAKELSTKIVETRKKALIRKFVGIRPNIEYLK